MKPSQLALVVVTVVGLINATFIGVVAWQISESADVGAVAALVCVIAEAVLVKKMGAKIGAQINSAMQGDPS